MAPQGIGAACIMRWAGSITDRFGPRRVVPFGILLMAAATVPFAFVTTSTSEVLLAVTLFVRGLGLGLSMMPVTAAAYFDLNHAEIPKASTVMNIVRLVGGSVATALFAVVLERQIVANLGSAGHEGRRAAPASSRHGQAAAPGRRPGGRGVRPHLLVVGRRHPDRLHPDPLPAQPRRRAVARPTPGRRADGETGRPPCRRGHARLTAPTPRSVDRRRAGGTPGRGRLRGRRGGGRASSSTRAGGDRRPLEALVERRLPASRWPGSPAGPPSATSTCAVDPGVYVPRWQSLELARRAAARLPERGTAVDLCTGSGAIAAGAPGGPARGARVVATDTDPRAVACARANGVEVYQGDLFAALPTVAAGTAPTSSWPSCPTSPPPRSRSSRATP